MPPILEDASLQEKFDCAVKVIRGLPKEGPFVPSHDLQLKFYSYFKQATEGPCTGYRPKMWEPVKRAKWDAWKAVGDISREQAMQNYIKELLAIVETMSFTDNVAEFLASMGPLAYMVNLEKVVGEEAARDFLEREPFIKKTSSVPDLSKMDHMENGLNAAMSTCSSEAFFSQEELEDDEADFELGGRSNPTWGAALGRANQNPAAAESSDESETTLVPGTNGKKAARAKAPTGGARRKSAGRAISSSGTNLEPLPCSCKEILDKMHKDLADLSNRVKKLEGSNHPNSTHDIDVEAHRVCARPSDGSVVTQILYKLRVFVSSIAKAGRRKPNYVVIFMWPVLLQVAVLLTLRYYFFR